MRDDAIRIWRAGVDSVNSSQAVSRAVIVQDDSLVIAGQRFKLSDVNRVEVVGAGKAGAGMAAGFELVLQNTAWFDRLSGWVNVPSDCLRSLQKIHLHPGRPPGVNEPTKEVINGTNEIVRRVQSLGSRDLCIVLLSGGASALLCSPVEGVSLEDKLQLTRMLAASGAPIQELNLVRTQLSNVKGGRLARRCSSGHMITLVISDVIGDPLDVIGSGPTYPAKARPDEALAVLKKRGLIDKVPLSVLQTLQHIDAGSSSFGNVERGPVHHEIVASNRIAIEHACREANRLGYEVVEVMQDVRGDAATQGRLMHQKLLHLRDSVRLESSKRLCVLGGGETTVNVASTSGPAGKGGRNQEFVLAALAAEPSPMAWSGIALVSGGTDGEDGPTDAAGAFCDAAVAVSATSHIPSASESIERHDSWTFLNNLNALIRTGPTHTNVMDVFVGVVHGAVMGSTPERCVPKAPEADVCM